MNTLQQQLSDLFYDDAQPEAEPETLLAKGTVTHAELVEMADLVYHQTPPKLKSQPPLIDFVEDCQPASVVPDNVRMKWKYVKKFYYHIDHFYANIKIVGDYAFFSTDFAAKLVKATESVSKKRNQPLKTMVRDTILVDNTGSTYLDLIIC